MWVADNITCLGKMPSPNFRPFLGHEGFSVWILGSEGMSGPQLL